MRHLKIPGDLVSAPLNNKMLKMNGISIVDSCFYDEKTIGSMFLEEHIVFYVVSGRAILSGSQLSRTDATLVVNKDEFVLLRRATFYDFIKEGDADGIGSSFHGVLFCLEEKVLTDFIKMAGITGNPSGDCAPKATHADTRLKAFVSSLIPYFEDSVCVDGKLLRLKLLELLYDIIHSDMNMQRQIIMLGKPMRKNISDVVDEYFLQPVSVPELAYLSGRSLSSFKREFQRLYGISPTRLIRERRLQYAMELLQSTDSSISEICYSSGFENPTHFTRLFKEYYGFPPTVARKKTV